MDQGVKHKRNSKIFELNNNENSTYYYFLALKRNMFLQKTSTEVSCCISVLFLLVTFWHIKARDTFYKTAQ